MRDVRGQRGQAVRDVRGQAVRDVRGQAVRDVREHARGQAVPFGFCQTSVE